MGTAHSAELLETIRMGMLPMLDGGTQVMFGHITAYDPTTNAVRCKLYPLTSDGSALSSGLNPAALLSDWIPLASPWAGNGWGFQAGPVIDPVGQQVVVQYITADPSSQGFAIAQLFNNYHVAPGAPSGELWIIHQTLTTGIKWKNSGTLDIAGTKTVNVGAPRVQLQASAFSETTLPATNGIVRQSDLQALITVFNTHVHASNGVPPTTPSGNATSSASSFSA